MDDTHAALSCWGGWWRRHDTHLGYPAVNQICRMMYEAKLGARVQTSRRHDKSEEIRVPGYIVQIDLAIAELPLRDRALLVALYQRKPVWNRKALKRKSPDLYRALLRAEFRVAASLVG